MPSSSRKLSKLDPSCLFLTVAPAHAFACSGVPPLHHAVDGCLRLTALQDNLPRNTAIPALLFHRALGAPRRAPASIYSATVGFVVVTDSYLARLSSLFAEVKHQTVPLRVRIIVVFRNQFHYL
jgi:hypothetical protein